MAVKQVQDKTRWLQRRQQENAAARLAGKTPWLRKTSTKFSNRWPHPPDSMPWSCLDKLRRLLSKWHNFARNLWENGLLQRLYRMLSNLTALHNMFLTFISYAKNAEVILRLDIMNSHLFDGLNYA